MQELTSELPRTHLRKRSDKSPATLDLRSLAAQDRSLIVFWHSCSRRPVAIRISQTGSEQEFSGVGQKKTWKLDHPYDVRMRMNRYMGGNQCELTREIRAGNGMRLMKLLDTRLCTWVTPPMSPDSIASISNRSRHHSYPVSNHGSKAPARGGRQL
jgi:hypothetical protein